MSDRRPCDTCGELMEEGNDTADLCQKCADKWASRIANYKTHCWACGHALNFTDTPNGNPIPFPAAHRGTPDE